MLVNVFAIKSHSNESQKIQDAIPNWYKNMPQIDD